MTSQLVENALRYARESDEHRESQELLLEACQASIMALAKENADRHWFCDSELSILAGKSLLVFAYSGTKQFEVFKTLLQPQLERCCDCIKTYHIHLASLESQLLDDICLMADNVHEFSRDVSNWNIERLQSQFTQSTPAISEKIEYALFECLCAPNLLSISHSLLENFKKAFELYEGEAKPESPLFKRSLLAGTIFFLFSEDPELHSWAVKTISKDFESKPSVDTVDVLMVNALNQVVREYLAIPRDMQSQAQFWTNVATFFTAMDGDVIRMKLCPSTSNNIVRLLSSVLLQYPSRLVLAPAIQCLQILLQNLGSNLWSLINPTTPSFLATQLLENSSLYEIDSPEQSPTNSAFEWALLLTEKSEPPSERHKVGVLISQKFKARLVSQSKAASYASTQSCLLTTIVKVSSLCLENEPKTTLPLIPEVARLVRFDSLQALDDLAPVITEHYGSLTETNTQLPFTQLLRNYIDFIVACAMPPSGDYKTLCAGAEHSIDAKLSLWSSLIDNPRLFKSSALSNHVLQAIQLSALIPHPTMRNNATFDPTSPLSSKVVKMATETLSALSEAPVAVLRDVIRNECSLKSLILQLFSASPNHNQAAQDVLSQVYDTDNRAESISALFSENLPIALKSTVSAIKTVRSIGLFSACPNLVSCIREVLACLYGSHGIINYDDENRATLSATIEENELLQFWTVIWEFLRLTFTRTPPWSISFPKDFMLEFMKDLLDLSKGLLDNFRFIEATLMNALREELVKSSKLSHSPSSQGDTSKDGPQWSLFQAVIDSIGPMCQFLRLRDESLAHSCVLNILTALDLMSSFKAPLPERVVVMFQKVATCAKPFENFLSEDQCLQLLTTSRAFSGAQIDDLLEQRRRKVSSKTLSPSTVPSESNTKSAPVITSAHVSKSKQRQVSLLDLIKQNEANNKMSNGRVSGPRAVLDAAYQRTTQTKTPEPHQPSAFEAIRADVMHSRAASGLHRPKIKSTPTVVHAARPAGFNDRKSNDAAHRRDASRSGLNNLEEAGMRTRRPMDKPNHNTDTSDDASSDDDSDDGLFHSKRKEGKHGPTPIPVQNPGSRAPIGLIQSERRLDGRRSEKYMSSEEKQLRDMAARLNADVTGLYKSVLKWDFHSTEFLPDREQKCEPIPDTFASVQAYQNAFKPLLMLECWQGVQQAREEQAAQKLNISFAVTTGNRVLCDDFTDLYVAVNTESSKEAATLSENDLLVLYHSRDTAEKNSAPPIERGMPCCFAKVTATKWSGKNAIDATLRTLNPKSLSPYMAQNNVLYAQKIYNMTTIEREYCALNTLQYYDLAEEVIRGLPGTPVFQSSEVSRICRSFGVNESQGKAILASAASKNFALIQGPPGTGKSKTIIALLGLLAFNPHQGKDKKRVLLCAPSNAAVDELVLRLKSGIENHNGVKFHPKVVRLGRSEAVNSAVQSLTLEELVDAKLKADEEEELKRPSNVTREEQQTLKKKRDELRQKLALRSLDLSEEQVNSIEMELRQLSRKIKEFGHELTRQSEAHTQAARRRESQRRNLQRELVQSADVICATLSGSAHKALLSLRLKFETVIIDEAAQCIELSALIPLKYGCKQCIMVGDPRQLPPTVLSQAAAKLKYEQSLFLRMYNQHRDKVHMLDVQYRMHPSISLFPSREFYDGKLFDGPDMSTITYRPWHKFKLFAPYMFFDNKGSSGVHERSHITKSLFNRGEATFILELYNKLHEHLPDCDLNSSNMVGKIGIVSPYKQQISILRQAFVKRYGQSILSELDFSTIDGFQGQEKDIIIMSCVRSSENDSSKGVGFLADVRRLNVALTRSRSSLWIVGTASSLTNNKVWRRLITNADERGSVWPVRDSRTFFSTMKKLEPANKIIDLTFEAKNVRSPHDSERASQSESHRKHNLIMDQPSSDNGQQSKRPRPSEVDSSPSEASMKRVASGKQTTNTDDKPQTLPENRKMEHADSFAKGVTNGPVDKLVSSREKYHDSDQSLSEKKIVAPPQKEAHRMSRNQHQRSSHSRGHIPASEGPHIRSDLHDLHDRGNPQSHGRHRSDIRGRGGGRSSYLHGTNGAPRGNYRGNYRGNSRGPS